MISISDLSLHFNTTEFRRDFDKHNARVEKLFWLAVIIYLSHCKREKQKPNVYLIIKTYGSIFYEYDKLLFAILENFNGISRQDIGAVLNSSARNVLKSAFNEHTWQILKPVQEFLERFNIDYSYVAPESIEIIDLAVVDLRHPHLEPVSNNIKLLLKAGNYQHSENSLIIDKSNKSIPRDLRIRLSQTADKLLLTELSYQAIQYLEDFLLLGQDYFTPFTKVEGPHQAVMNAMGLNPGLKNEPPAKLNYHIRLKYRSLSNARFKKDSIAKALRRYFEE